MVVFFRQKRKEKTFPEKSLYKKKIQSSFVFKHPDYIIITESKAKFCQSFSFFFWTNRFCALHNTHTQWTLSSVSILKLKILVLANSYSQNRTEQNRRVATRNTPIKKENPRFPPPKKFYKASSSSSIFAFQETFQEFSFFPFKILLL